jgi:hypothetical protein
MGFRPVSPGQETLVCTTQLDAQASGGRRAHWFSIAVRRSFRWVAIGVRSRHVGSSNSGTHRTRSGIGLGLPAAARHTSQ